MECNGKLQGSGEYKIKIKNSKDSVEIDETNKYVDGGYAWIILCCSIVLQLFGSSSLGTYGVLLVNIVDATGHSTSFISWYGALTCFAQSISAFFVGPLVEVYSCRIVTVVGSLICTISFILTAFVRGISLILVTLGLLQGLGVSCFFICPNIIVSKWFSEKRSMALTMITFGKGVGQLFWGPYTAYMIDLFGWRGSLMMIGGILLNGCVLGVMIKDPIPKGSNRKRNLNTILKRLVPIKLLKTKWYICFIICNFPLIIGHSAITAMLPRRIVDAGYSNLKASTSISIIGGTTSVARLILGSLTSMKYFNKTIASATSAIIVGVLSIMTIFFKNYTSYAIFSALFGCFSG